MEDSYRSFTEIFRCCRLDSCMKRAYRQTAEDPEFIEAEKEYQELYGRIKEKLGKDGFLIGDFDDARTHMLNMYDIFVYQQGFRDCVYLLHWIGLI